MPLQKPKNGRPKGLPKTGGRKKGTPNKRTLYKKKAAEIIRAGDDPVEFLVRLMKNEELATGFRAQCARDAAPYIRPKLATVTLQGDADKPVVTHELDKADYRKIARDVASKL